MTSQTIGAFRKLVARWRGDWLVDDEGAIRAIPELTKRFRNRAAHRDELEESDYQACREFVAGPSGVLVRLLNATGV